MPPGFAFRLERNNAKSHKRTTSEQRNGSDDPRDPSPPPAQRTVSGDANTGLVRNSQRRMDRVQMPPPQEAHAETFPTDLAFVRFLSRVPPHVGDDARLSQGFVSAIRTEERLAPETGLSSAPDSVLLLRQCLHFQRAKRVP